MKLKIIHFEKVKLENLEEIIMFENNTFLKSKFGRDYCVSKKRSRVYFYMYPIFKGHFRLFS